MPLGTETDLGPGDSVLDDDPAPLHKKGRSPQYSAYVYCSQTAGCIKMVLGMEVDLGPGNIVLAPLPPPRKMGHRPQFSAHVYCGQTAVCIRIPLGTEVGLSLGDTVRWGPSSPSREGAQPPIFGQCRCGPTAGWTKMPLRIKVGLGPGEFVFDREGHSLTQFLTHVYCGQTAGWIKICHLVRSRPRPRRRCVRWGRSSPSLKGAQPPSFRPMPIVAMWLNGWMDEDAS